MNYSEALKAAQAGKPVVLLDRDATGNWASNHVCWLEDGELVMASPTDSKRRWISAPEDGKYTLGNQAAIDEDAQLQDRNAQEAAKETFELG